MTGDSDPPITEPKLGFHAVRDVVRASRACYTGVWIVLESRINVVKQSKPIGTRFVKSAHLDRDLNAHMASGWVMVSALFVQRKSQEDRLFRLLDGKSRKKVRGLISKTAVFDAFAKRHNLDLYTAFDEVFGFKCEHLIKRITSSS
jgi:hypothetical protein